MKEGSEFLYKKESYDIIDACQEVWKQFGGSFKESIVDRALEIALRDKGYKIENQKQINIYFRNKKVGIYIPDKIINEIILLEIKCKQFITKEDERQFWHYLKASSYRLGFLINFGPQKLEFRRRVYDKARKTK
jgi:GxxExxY protein